MTLGLTWVDVIRITGLLAWWVLALDVLAGLILAGNVARYAVVTPRRRINWHAGIGYALAATVAVHLTAIIYSHINGWDTMDLVAVGYGTWARNLGVITAWLIAIVMVSSVLKHRIGHLWWRRLHQLTLPILMAGTAHGLLAGPDQTSLLVLMPGVVVLTLMGAVMLARLYQNYIKVRGNYRNRKALLLVITQPHGLHFKKKFAEVHKPPNRKKSV